MICDICHKNKATIIYTEVINGEKTQRCFCDECAALMNSKAPGKQSKSDLPMGSILSGILSSYMERYIESRTPNKHDEAVCPTCGMKFSTFMKERLLGCPDCYGAFSMVIEKQLKAVQPGTVHAGKIPENAMIYNTTATECTLSSLNAATDAPVRGGKKKASAGKTGKKAGLASDEASLRRQLEDAVRKEDYMLAAKLRDKIKELKNEKKDN